MSNFDNLSAPAALAAAVTTVAVTAAAANALPSMHNNLGLNSSPAKADNILQNAYDALLGSPDGVQRTLDAADKGISQAASWLWNALPSFSSLFSSEPAPQGVITIQLTDGTTVSRS